MLVVTGISTTIVQEYKRISGEGVHRWPATGRKFLFAQGFLRQNNAAEQSYRDAAEGFDINAIDVIRKCEAALRIADARICVIGSESAFKGSYDMNYAAAKAALHGYVETRTVLPTQQLVCISPSVIKDSGMTRRRHDYEIIKHQELLSARDVAQLAHFLLNDGFRVSNTVVRIGKCLR